jgi:hypothetical protein
VTNTNPYEDANLAYLKELKTRSIKTMLELKKLKDFE